MTKICNKCGLEKELLEYSPAQRGKFGGRGDCKECTNKRMIKYRKEHPEVSKKWRTKNKDYYKNWWKENKDRQKDYNLQKKFGITLNDYNKILSEQNGLCAICGKKEELNFDKRINKSRLLSVDHDHTTGKVRELLCNKCNHLLGLANDSFEILDKASNYLRKYNE